MRRWFRPSIWAWAVGVAAVDQATKYWALEALTRGRRIDLIGELLGLELVFNSGAAFSLLRDVTWIVTVVMVIVAAGLVYYSPRARGTLGVVLFGAAIGGAVGNLIDRLFREPGFGRGHVVDMIAYGDWFVGNVADIAIVGCAGIAVFASVRGVPLLAEPKPGANQAEGE